MQKTFDEVVLFARTGLNPRQNFKLGQGNNYYITIKNIKNNSLVIDDNTDVVNDEAIKLIHKRSQIKKGDILFASIGRMGDMYIIEEEPMVWDINESVFAFTLDTSIVRQKYFYYIFRVKSTLDYLASNSSGSTFKSIKMNQLKKMKFEIPALDKQDQIVAVLDKICNIIEMRKQELGSLDDLIKARFVEIFDGKYPEDTLLNLCNIIDYRGKTPKKVERGLPFITAKNVKMHHMTLEPLEYISKETYDKVMVRGFPKEGDVVFTTEAPLGNVCRIPHFNTEFYIGQRIVTMQTEELNPTYLEYALSAEEFIRKYMGNSSGSTVIGIRVRLLEQLTIQVPPRGLQDEFAIFVEQVDKSKLMFQKLHQKLNILRQKAGDI